jgi:hypothetical protein
MRWKDMPVIKTFPRFAQAQVFTSLQLAKLLCYNPRRFTPAAVSRGSVIFLVCVQLFATSWPGEPR